VRQIAAQMRDPEARGVLDKLVFIVTNSCILATALVGQGCLWWRRRRPSCGAAP